jgi:hypothetical protein
MVGWLVNDEFLVEGSGRGQFEVLSRHVPGGREERNRRAQVRIACLQTEIRTRDLANINQDF